jgi:REP element-mobilizing transposase RayT
VTVCTVERRCILAHVRDESVVTTSFGAIVERQIAELPVRFTRIEIDSFVIMPNHIHVIVALGRAGQASPLRVGLGHAVAVLKSCSAREINRSRGTPGGPVWQRGYHDHIVRDEADLRRLREYVAANPIKWALDPENPMRARLASPSRSGSLGATEATGS